VIIIELTNSFNVYDGAGSGLRFGHTEYNTFQGGVFPENIGNLSHLKVIDMAFSEFDETSIPQSITKLDSLKTLKFYHCGLSGSIPNNIGNLRNLEELIIDENNLSGELPSSVFDLKKLKMLRLSFNNALSGNLDSIGKLQNLTFIQFINTQIGGRLPADVFNLPYLQEFMGSDHLYGPVPVVERTNETLLSFFLSNSQLEGNLLTTLSHCKKLRNLELSNNKFSGEIPSDFYNLKDLFGVRLDNNNFTGNISNIGKLSNLVWFQITGNQLTGNIPSDISELKKIWDLDFSNNKFEELEPLNRDSLPGLRFFKVENNKLEFKSFENNLNLLEEDFFTFSPQDSIGESFIAHIPEGEDFNYQFSCSGTNNLYKWFHNGIAIGEATGDGDLNLNDLSTEDYGEYVCEITNPLVDQLKLYSSPVSVMGITELSELANILMDIELYPNPAHDFIQMRNIIKGDVSLSIFNLNGMLLFSKKILSDEKILVNNLNEGIYIVKIESQGETMIKKLIKK
jgi:Leucine-rich repeat (LRR) protein